MDFVYTIQSANLIPVFGYALAFIASCGISLYLLTKI